MDMDTEYPGLSIRKYVEPVEDMEVILKVSKSRTRECRPTSLSPFERLPLELRQEIYSYLGVPIARKVNPKSGPAEISRYTLSHLDTNSPIPFGYMNAWTTCDMYRLPCNSLPEMYESEIPFLDLEIESAIFWLNESFQAEVWETMLQDTEVVFGTELGKGGIIGRGIDMMMGSNIPWSFCSRSLGEAHFRNLTQVSISEHCGRYLPQISARNYVRRALLGQAASVRYIADHCPFLRIFGLQPYLRGSTSWGSLKRHLHNVAPKSIEALVQALVHMSKKSKRLEQIKIQEAVEYHHPQECWRHQDPSRCGNHRCRCETQDWYLDLWDIEWYLREEVTEDWVRYMLNLLRFYDPLPYIEA